MAEGQLLLETQAINDRLDSMIAEIMGMVQALKALTMPAVRVGRIMPRGTPGPKYPTTPGYVNLPIVSAVRSPFSPLLLQDDAGRYMENVWQFTKIYQQVPAFKVPNSSWNWPAEQHVNGTTIVSAYWRWRNVGLRSAALRSPVPGAYRKTCLGCLWPMRLVALMTGCDVDWKSVYRKLDLRPIVGEEYAMLTYVQARRLVYFPLYSALATGLPDFADLQKMLAAGERLQLLDIDGPREVPSIAITEDEIRRRIDDPSQPFGHGYALAASLLFPGLCAQLAAEIAPGIKAACTYALR